MNSLIRFSPARDLQNEIDRLFEGILPSRPSNGDPTTMWTPRVDVLETEDAYKIELDVPGMNKDDIQVNYHEGALTVSGSRETEQKEEGTDYIRLERRTGNFYRSFTLPKAVQADRISANYENGVLLVTVPKAEESKPQRISIR